MSKIVVDLSQIKSDVAMPQMSQGAGDNPPVKKGRGCLRILGILGILTIVILLIGAVGGYFYWQSVKKTPQYSLALLVDAARRDDKEKVAEIIDTTEVVNNFVPQISEKATELYGRNLPPQIIAKISQIVTPLMPAIKEKAKEELPQMIREKTGKFDKYPYWMIALFADRGLEVKVDGDKAEIKSKNSENAVEFTMKRDGDLWKIIAIKDEKLARKVAEKIGQQLMVLFKKGNLKDAEKQLQIDNLGNVLKDLNNIFR